MGYELIFNGLPDAMLWRSVNAFPTYLDITFEPPTIRPMAFHSKNRFAALLVWVLPMMGMSAEETKLKPEVKQRLELLKAGFDSFVLKTVTIPFEGGLARRRTRQKADSPNLVTRLSPL
jgi:hypothetical protein